MISEIVAGILNWVVKSLVTPLAQYIGDYFTLNKAIDKSTKAAGDLNNAKSSADIDHSIDELP